MKVLVLGGNGMAGHLIKEYLSKTCEVHYSIRESSDDPRATMLDLTDENATFHCLTHIKPDIVINAAGVLNQDAANRLKEAILINSVLPHKLSAWGRELRFRLIHISTDCVFSGLKGNYVEDDRKDGDTVYAITKNVGEVIDTKHLTIRTSIVGPEIRKNGIGLFHWFTKQTGTVHGYHEAFWNGVTTLELAKAIDWAIGHHTKGLVHLTGRNRISKFDLLVLFQEILHQDIEIIPFQNERVDKTLMNTRKDFSYRTPDYRKMIKEMKEWIEQRPQLYPHYK